MSELSPPPKFELLVDVVMRARLISLRAAVSEILATNNLPHFTDHSVSHSDELCRIVDELSAPNRGKAERLTDTEAFVLYASCYLHDVGMQHDRADQTVFMRNQLAAEPFSGRSWGDLSVATRRNLLRIHHHEMSREMVLSCVNAPQPNVLGFQLVESDNPGYIASLCKAHNLDTKSSGYQQLTEPGPGLRMPLLSALLRLADIFDESRRRAQIHRELTVQLDIESRMHWWRHYYTRGIEFAPAERQIMLWFDFPPDRRDEYSRLIPELQLPWLQAEMSRHAAVLAKHDLMWHLEVRHTPSASCIAVPMPDEVHAHMARRLAERTEQALIEERRLLLRHLKDIRPLIRRRLNDLRLNAESADPKEYLTQACRVAEELWNIGGKRDAWILLRSEFNRLRERASPDVRMGPALLLVGMMLSDDAAQEGKRTLEDLEPHAASLRDDEPVKAQFYHILSQVLIEICAYEDGMTALAEFQRIAPDRAQREEAKARAAEIHLLQGDLSAALKSAEDEIST